MYGVDANYMKGIYLTPHQVRFDMKTFYSGRDIYMTSHQFRLHMKSFYSGRDNNLTSHQDKFEMKTFYSVVGHSEIKTCVADTKMLDLIGIHLSGCLRHQGINLALLSRYCQDEDSLWQDNQFTM